MCVCVVLGVCVCVVLGVCVLYWVCVCVVLGVCVCCTYVCMAVASGQMVYANSFV